MKRFDSINVIPFIDILLVLLAMVLTTATFVQNGQIKMTLPTASSNDLDQEEDASSIAIDANRQLYFNGTTVSIERLEKELRLLSINTPIALRIDRAVPFERVVELIDLLKTLSLNRLSISVKQLQ